MNNIVPQNTDKALVNVKNFVLPPAIAELGLRAAKRFVDFFTARIPNKNTLIAYAWAAAQFLSWKQKQNLKLLEVEPFIVATYIEKHPGSVPTKKQHLAAIRTLFDYLVTGQVMPSNPSAPVKAPKHVVRTGKTHVLEDGEIRKLLDSITKAIENSSRNTRLIALRDRALISTMFFTFAR